MKKETESVNLVKITPEQIAQCIDVLERLNADTDQIFNIPKESRLALLMAAGQFSRPSKEELAERKKGAKKIHRKKVADKDKSARKTTGIRSAREASVFIAPSMLSLTGKEADEAIQLESPRECYVCKNSFDRLHHFYDTMCANCGDFNYAKRFQTADLKGQVALVTGSRLKIGYHITLMMLRAGATVIATTRFPVDSALRFAKEPDFNEWCDRLHIHGLDLRHIPSVEIFCSYIEQQYDRLDVLINNAGLSQGLDPLDRGETDDWDRMIDTNIKGLLYVSRMILPGMKERKAGHIINIGSIAGKEVYPNGNVYCATKHAVDALNKSMRMELLPYQIKVTALHPGAVKTEFSEVRFKGDIRRASQVYEGFLPLLAVDVADAAWYVASRPAHVNINEIIIMPASQANGTMFNKNQNGT